MFLMVMTSKHLSFNRSLVRMNQNAQLSNSQDLISTSPYCLLYNSYDVSLENLELDELIIP